ncbi:hypothetical protein DICVIV_10956 [Dictyocaulus viviparus]|uniref:Uncharacterized protein n=1 Tax=Dictyocaulus viviparus TaxID=29172 RepID=A0A0D8XH25_DICVI|nr:hypothetical protein DICVIV_10956 [Dictyocaulus viviparus]
MFPSSAVLLLASCTYSKTTSQNVSSTSTVSAAAGFILNEEPITLYRLELERLQCILHFPEEVAFQLSTTEYQLFYSNQPMDYVRFVSCDLTSVPIAENPSPVRNLVKRLSEVRMYFHFDYSAEVSCNFELQVSSWITHVIENEPIALCLMLLDPGNFCANYEETDRVTDVVDSFK